ncbi:MAG TPA: 50S ribosomal protein L9 [Gammaproteobacteria bacterium]|nr:50S ribosomal protein L9 [Gammaproteobacteria bacterium]
MKVLLKENIKNLGKVGESVDVSPGYARNWLIPQGKVLLVNDANRKAIEDQLKGLKLIEATKQKEAQTLVDTIAALGDIVLDHRLNEEGRLFGSVGISNIVDYYKEKGQAVQRKDINLVNAPIKELGEYELVFSPYQDIKTVIKIKVISSTAEAEASSTESSTQESKDDE